MGSGTSRVNRYDNENKTVRTRTSRNKNLYDDFNNFEKYTNFTDVSKIEAVPLDSLRENANKREGYRYLKDYDLVEKKKERKELDDFNYLYRNTRGNYNLKEALEEARESREKDELEKKRKLRNEKYNILESSEEELNEFKEEQKKRHKPIENEEELEEIYEKLQLIYEEAQEYEKVWEISREAVEVLPDSERLWMNYLERYCENPEMERELCAEAVKKAIQAVPELAESEAFKQLQGKYKIVIDGENIRVGE